LAVLICGRKSEAEGTEKGPLLMVARGIVNGAGVLGTIKRRGKMLVQLPSVRLNET